MMGVVSSSSEVAKIVHCGLLRLHAEPLVGAYANARNLGVSRRFRALLATVGRN
jgi:hypothetical protein